MSLAPRSLRRRLGLAALAVLGMGLPAAFIAAPAAAAPGDLDLTFDTDGKVTTDVGASDFGYDVTTQLDGKIVVAGTSGGDFALVRYNPNGSLDTSFDTDGKVTTDIAGATAEAARSVVVQADGKIVAAGESNVDMAVVRYNANGSLDTTFDTDGKLTTDFGPATTDAARSVVVQADGKLVVGGSRNNEFAVVRYNADGSLDTSFDSDGKATTDLGTNSIDHGYDVALQADGKIVLAGVASGDIAMVRYNANGSLDTTFDADGKLSTDIGNADDGALSVAVQADGRIVAGGYSGNGSTYDFAVVRYDANGSLDTTFDADGVVTTDIGTTTYDVIERVVLQADGKIIAAGPGGETDSLSNFAVARYLPTGGLDTSFNVTGKAVTDIGSGTNDFARGATLQLDGKIVVAGITSTDFAAVRYQGDPSVIVNDATVTEGDFGTTNATFTVALFSAGTTSASVSYATANGTATAGSDYAATAGTLSFAPGETVKTVSVPVVADGVDEADEAFSLNLFSPTNIAVVVDGQGTATIKDDDGEPGYWLVASDGGIFAFNVPFSGSTGALTLNKPIVGMAADPDGKGYWLVATDGGIFAFDAPFFGSTGALKLNRPIVGMAPTPTGKGYFLVASDGGIFAFGDAVFKGSTGAIALNKPIVGMATTPTGGGYYLVATDGGIFAFGDAVFKGSTGALKLNQPIAGMAVDSDGTGYYLVATDGGIFAFDAPFFGSTGALKLNRPIVGMAADPDGQGYYLVATDGGIFAFGAVFKGSTGALTLNRPIVGMATST